MEAMDEADMGTQRAAGGDGEGGHAITLGVWRLLFNAPRGTAQSQVAVSASISRNPNKTDIEHVQ
jgi:hypothetical protein